jgi:hypothetical protein
MALDEPRERLLITAPGNPPPTHDRRQAHDQLRE